MMVLIRAYIMYIADGFEAIDMVKKTAPDFGSYHLILMDVQMPGCDGLEVRYEHKSLHTHARTLSHLRLARAGSCS